MACFGFDFEAVHDEVIDQKKITHSMTDGRQITTSFGNADGKIKIITIFNSINENPVDLQKNGWQTILSDFKK